MSGKSNNKLHPLNNEDISFTFVVFKFEILIIDANDEQFENINDISVLLSIFSINSNWADNN